MLFNAKKICDIKEIRKYIEACLSTENIFYIIDNDFWENWIKLSYKKYTDKMFLNTGLIYEPVNIYKNDQIEKDGFSITENKKNISELLINTNCISDKNGKIKPNLRVLIDYIILDSKLFKMFKNCYKINGPEIKRFLVAKPKCAN